MGCNCGNSERGAGSSEPVGPKNKGFYWTGPERRERQEPANSTKKASASKKSSSSSKRSSSKKA
jgi:hypothetical protein